MWRTSAGDRVLRGCEARLFAVGALEVISRLGESSNNPQASAKAFYSLAKERRAVVLCEVIEALLRPSVPVLEHTAVREAAIAAIFDGVLRALEAEMEKPEGHIRGPVRRLIRRILWRYLPDSTVPALLGSEWEDWEMAIESILDRILFDRDFEDEVGAKLPEHRQAQVMEYMRIEPGYYAHLPEAVSSEVSDVLIDRMTAICEAVV